MFIQLFRNWWWLALRGLIAIVFGVLALIWPQRASFSVILTFGAFALLDAFFTLLWGMISMASYDRLWAIQRGAVASVIIGLAGFFWPAQTAVVLLYAVATWAVITGVLEIMTAIQLRRLILQKQVLFIYGMLSVLFGVLLFVLPSTHAWSLVWVFGLYLTVMGTMLIILGFRVRDMQYPIEATTASAA